MGSTDATRTVRARAIIVMGLAMCALLVWHDCDRSLPFDAPPPVGIPGQQPVTGEERPKVTRDDRVAVEQVMTLFVRDSVTRGALDEASMCVPDPHWLAQCESSNKRQGSFDPAAFSALGRSDADGSLRIVRSVLAGHRSFLVFRPRYQPQLLASEAIVDGLTVLLRPLRPVTIRCVDASGTPVPGARVSLCRIPTAEPYANLDGCMALSASLLQGRQSTDEQGVAEFDADVGEPLYLDVVKDGFVLIDAPDRCRLEVGVHAARLVLAEVWVASCLPTAERIASSFVDRGGDLGSTTFLAAMACRRMEARLRRRHPGAFVCCAAGLEVVPREQRRLPVKCLVTNTGRVDQVLDFVRLADFRSPAELSVSDQPQRHWAHVRISMSHPALGREHGPHLQEVISTMELEAASDGGSPGGAPHTAILGDNGSFLCPPGRYRAKCHAYPVLDEILAGTVMSVGEHDDIERVLELPSSIVPVRFGFVTVSGASPSSVSIQLCRNGRWQHLGVWNEDDPIAWMPRDTCTVRCISATAQCEREVTLGERFAPFGLLNVTLDRAW